MTDTLSLPPLPPPLRTTLPALRRFRSLLAWGFGVSIVLHAILGPIVGTYRTPVAETSEIQIVSLSRRTNIKLPTPTPTRVPLKPATPPPTTPLHNRIVPPGGSTAPPAAAHQTRPALRLKINTYTSKSASKDGSPIEAPYRVQTGSQLGVPQGTRGSGSPGGSVSPVLAPSSASPAHESASTDISSSRQSATPGAPLRTAPPACAVPNVDARATHLVVPFYPQALRDLGTTGEADVLVTLSEGGAVTAATIYRTSNNAKLDDAALRAARESAYSPEIVACRATGGSYTFHASFELDSTQ